MRGQRLNKQGGSAATFIVVGIVLAVLVVGGVYTVQKRGQGTEKSNPVAVNTHSPSPSRQPAKSSPKATSTPAPKPSKTPTPPASVKPSPVPTNNAVKGSNSLPVTGPQDGLVNAFMLAVLVGVAAAFLRSTRVRYGFQTE